MGSFLIVEPHPPGQLLGSLIARAVETRVGPLPQQCLDESLGLPVGLGAARASADMAQAKRKAAIAEMVCSTRPQMR